MTPIAALDSPGPRPRDRRRAPARRLAAAGLLAAGLGLWPGAPVARGQTFPSSLDVPPPGWTGPVFALSQDYPATLPAPEAHPWDAINFRTAFVAYPRAVLRYALEGNVEVDWRGQDNAVRAWYHAPWMHSGAAGREFVHGLTRERPSRPGELHANQTRTVENWAVSLYNAPGGFTIGQVWADPEAPDASAARFPVGTVAIKLLFTTATPEDAPFLAGSPEWQANIGSPRRVATVRLLQVDIAVRDARADDTTGWVFSTFVYDAAAPGTVKYRPWDKLSVVGTMWGNDPAALEDDGPLSESRISATGRRVVTHLGWRDRLNGPVDNPSSSCLSCHGTAQDPVVRQMVPRVTSLASLRRYFRNVPAGVAFDADENPAALSTDYSLQLSTGIRNQRLANTVGADAAAALEAEPLRAGVEDTREYPGDGPPPRREGAPDGPAPAAGAPPAAGAASTSSPPEPAATVSPDAASEEGSAASGPQAAASTPAATSPAAADAPPTASGGVGGAPPTPASGSAPDAGAGARPTAGALAALAAAAAGALAALWAWRRRRSAGG